ncbi:MAG: lysylphosphatidylglycerol synthase transmembrane domain-containing protein [Bacteroidota bacterium]
MILVAGLLLWLSLSSIQVPEGESRTSFLLENWNTADKWFLIFSGIMALVSHAVRAERWKILLAPLGHQISFKKSFLSVMIGYFVNLAIPRGGELSRCYNLYKLDDVPADESFGTVIAERVVDLIFLVLLIAISFLIELDKLIEFFMAIDYSGGGKGAEGQGFPWLYALGGVFFLGLIATVLYLRKKRILRLRILSKVITAFKGIKNGLRVIFKLKPGRRNFFIFYSLLIWVLYYLMSYFVILAFPETENLGLLATLTIFVIGGIAMAIPLPGGTGSYHVLVPLGLSYLYQLADDKAKAFTFIFHGWQLVIIIIFGLMALIWSRLLYKTKLRNANVRKNT